MAEFEAIINLSTLNGTNGFRLNGTAAFDYSGRSVASAGDVNGDGFDDFIIGAPLADPKGLYSGSSYVVFGRAGGFPASLNLSALNGTNGFRLDGAAANDRSGSSVASAGDVNGDGFDDLIIGAFGASPNGVDSGSSYVVFGRAGGFAAKLNLSKLNGKNGFRLDGVAANDLSGRSVASAGDVNGDGFDDLIIGAPLASPNGLNSGSSYVVFGRAGGFAAALDLSALDGTNGFRVDGVAANNLSGRSVASAGDVNGDGFDDLIIGAYRAAPNGLESGSSYVVFGRAGGFAATLNLSKLNGKNGFRIDGAAASDRSGYSVASAGDVNGDGFDDLIIGADGADPNGLNSGSSYVVFGRAGGFAAALDLSALNGKNGFRIDGVAAADYSGFSVASAGDVNGDGFDDLIIGAYYADPNGSGSGSSYVVFGRAGGFAASLNLSALDGTNGFRLDGVAAYDRSGRSVASAGDVNGDGFDDLIVGAPSADPNGSSSGSSYIVFGRAPDGPVTRIGAAGDQKIMGGAFNDTLSGRGGADMLFGGAGHDTLLGGAGNDELRGGRGNDILRGGSGNDMLFGNGGDDRLAGNGGQDILQGGPGNDVLLGGGGSDRLSGGRGSDMLRGDGGNDRLEGGAGSDVLIGGRGNDLLIGGPGADTFVFQPKGGNDVVVDFQNDLDQLDFGAFGFASKASVLNLASQVGANVVFDLPGGVTVELNNFSITLLGAEDILI